MNDDLQHLKLLSIFHFVVGGMIALAGCIPLIHLTFGLAVLFGGFRPPDMGPDELRLFGMMFTIVSLIFILPLWSLALVVCIAGWKLGRRKWYMYCFVVACIECAMVPMGTVLGVFTILVLSRPSVKQLFGVENGVNP